MVQQCMQAMAEQERIKRHLEEKNKKARMKLHGIKEDGQQKR